MAAASGNDATPVFSIFLECFSLEGIDLVADNAGNLHWSSPGLRDGCSSLAVDGEDHTHRGDGQHGLAPVDPVGSRPCRRHRWKYSSCHATTLRLTSKYERRATGSRDLENRRRYGRGGPGPHPVLPSRWARANEHRTCRGSRSERLHHAGPP